LRLIPSIHAVRLTAVVGDGHDEDGLAVHLHPFGREQIETGTTQPGGCVQVVEDALGVVHPFDDMNLAAVRDALDHTHDQSPTLSVRERGEARCQFRWALPSRLELKKLPLVIALHKALHLTRVDGTPPRSDVTRHVSPAVTLATLLIRAVIVHCPVPRACSRRPTS